MGERDPKKDPQHGDILRKGRWERHVLACRRYALAIQYVDYVAVREDGATWPAEYLLTTWRRWARDAEVIERGEE